MALCDSPSDPAAFLALVNLFSRLVSMIIWRGPVGTRSALCEAGNNISIFRGRFSGQNNGQHCCTRPRIWGNGISRLFSSLILNFPIPLQLSFHFLWEDFHKRIHHIRVFFRFWFWFARLLGPTVIYFFFNFFNCPAATLSIENSRKKRNLYRITIAYWWTRISGTMAL